MIAEISLDLVMDDDMSFVEGCYRLPGAEWRVFIFSKRDTAEVTWQFGSWDRGVKGVVLYVPRTEKLNRSKVQAHLSRVLGVESWSEVKGPDSMVLR
jgi:hypothetical protein